MATEVLEDKRLVQKGFINVETEKGALLKKLKENREKHVADFKKASILYEQALYAYAKEFTAQLEKKIKKFKTQLDKKSVEVKTAFESIDKNQTTPIDLKTINSNMRFDINPNVQLTVQKPISQEKQYDEVIEMLELSTAEFVLLTNSEFKSYVLDDWSWKPSFYNNTGLLCSGTTMSGNLYFTNLGATHDDGYYTTAMGDSSHAVGSYSHAEGVASIGGSILNNSVDSATDFNSLNS